MRVLWFTFQVQSETWSVYLVDPDEYSELDGKEGLCLFSQACIYINWRTALSRIGPVVYHEMCHAWNDAVSFERQSRYILGLEKSMDSEQEEALVCLRAPTEYDSLHRSGFLAFPPMPERV